MLRSSLKFMQLLKLEEIEVLSMVPKYCDDPYYCTIYNHPTPIRIIVANRSEAEVKVL